MTAEQPRAKKRPWLLFAFWALLGVLVVTGIAAGEFLSTRKGKRFAKLAPLALKSMASFEVEFAPGTPPQLPASAETASALVHGDEFPRPSGARIRREPLRFLVGMRDHSRPEGPFVVEYVFRSSGLSESSLCSGLALTSPTRVTQLAATPAATRFGPCAELSLPARLSFLWAAARLDVELFDHRLLSE